MSNANIARQIKRTDELIAKFEAETVKSVEKAMDAAFRKLEQEFRRKWLALESRDLVGQDRAILLIEQIKQYLEILPSDSDHIQKLYEDLALDSQRAGIEFGANAIESITGFTAATVKPNLKAIAFQSQDAAKRLYRHSADFQIRASQVIQQGLVGGSGVAKVAEQLRRELGITKAKAETIARTESMAATDSATRDTYRQNGIGYVQRIGTQDDRICPYCAARVGNVYPIDKAPAILHPRDRCFNSPFSPDWVDAGLIDQAWLKNHREQSIAALGDKQPDYGASPFEQMAGQFAPKPIWTVDGGFEAAQNPEPPNAGYTNRFIDKGRQSTQSIEKDFKAATAKVQLAESRLTVAEKAFDAKFDELNDMSAAFKSQEGREYLEASDLLDKAKAERSNLLLEKMSEIRRDLIKANPSDPKVAKIKISKKATTEMAESDLRANIDEFSRITGGRGVSNLKKIVLDDDRAWADDETGELNIGRRNGDVADIRRVLFHELGHFLEFENPDIAKAANEWIKSRATGKLAKLKDDISPGYEDEEVYYPDKFIDPYVGRFYGDGATEVVSMGIENFTDPLKMAELYSKDSEHFNFIMGILIND